MKKRTRNIIIIIVGLQIILILGLLMLPAIVGAIPGRYRVALAERSPFLSGMTEGVIDAVAPVATALPAPVQGSQGQAVDIAALIGEQATVTAVATPLPEPTVVPSAAETAVPENESETLDVTAVPTQQPSPTPAPTATATPEPLPERVVLEGLGVVKQSFNNCGPANLTQVLNFHGNDISQAEVASYLKPSSEDRNVSPWQIADYVNVETPGLNAIARSGGTIEMIKNFIAAGYPVVIEKGYELPETGWWGHYLTMFGYDDVQQEFYSQDSYLGPFDGSGRVDSYEEIEKFWQQFNYTFYVVYSPEQEAEVAAILGPEMFDDIEMWKTAAARAEAETQTNPDDAIAWFNLGTALTRIGEKTGAQEFYQGGAQAYDRARELGLPPRMLWYQFQPYLAYMKIGRYQDMLDLADATLATQGGRNVEETFWYKGHALAFLGDIFGAREAYQEALNVNENFYPAQWSLDALN